MKVHIHYKVNWRLKWNSLRQREKYNKVENHKNKRIQDEVAKCHSSLKTEVPTTFILSTSYYTLWFMLDEMYPVYHLKFCYYFGMKNQSFAFHFIHIPKVWQILKHCLWKIFVEQKYLYFWRVFVCQNDMQGWVQFSGTFDLFFLLLFFDL